EEAKRLLRYGDKPISQIAEYLGYSSQSHFSTAFRDATGLSPKEYRASFLDRE
ncbi:MAG: helix-turn-helix domain-containing protein, partial [Candidatus Enteromonas sp.]